MTLHTFAALGFDPAPGDVDALVTLARDCGRLGGDLGVDATQVRRLADGGVWRGSAADAFRHRLRDLPSDLDRAGEAYVEAAGALLRFSAALGDAQLVARALEQRAADLESRTLDDGALIDRVRREAEELRERVLDAASSCGRALRDATRHAPHPPGWFSHLVDAGAHLVRSVNQAVGDFVREHAAGIALFADVLSKVSSALALVAMLAGPIPVVGQAVGSLAATGALLAAGGALLGHTALAAYAGGSWTTVVLDGVAVATGLGPHGVEAVAGRVVAARGLELGETGMTTRTALGVLRHPAAGVARMAEATMTFPQLVTRTISYQFDLTAGAVGIVDLARTGDLRAEVRESGERGRRARERQ
ncbi:MAG: hypothetical protein JWO22_243, partial [Frankiales bacterium]|nr:hypothetical protein [Frankiales bacterium]